jgi:hypothetical protein
MKKIALLAVVLSVLFLTQATPSASACSKYAELISTGDGDRRVEVGENVVVKIAIAIMHTWHWSTEDWTDVVVTDRLAAEWEIDSIDHVGKGTVSWYTTGNSEKVHLTWYIGTLSPGELVWLNFTISTDLNPAGRQEFTSPGIYELNSGPVMKWMASGMQWSNELNSLEIGVDPSGIEVD